MIYEEALAYLENYTWSKTWLDLGRTRELTAKLGEIRRRSLRFVHVGGSNGKGSTCAMICVRSRRAAGIGPACTQRHIYRPSVNAVR